MLINNKKEAGTKNYISPQKMNSKIKRDEHPKASTSLAQYKNHLQEENDERNGRKAARPGPKEIKAIRTGALNGVRGLDGSTDNLYGIQAFI